MAHQVQYSRPALEHLRNLSARERSMVMDRIERSLVDQPAVETRNRKKMRPNPLAPWELRIGDLRVYYDIEGDVVIILAIGRKDGNRIIIEGQEIDL